MILHELNVLLNQFPEHAAGFLQEESVIATLDTFGKRMGYGALAQLAQHLYLIQCHHQPETPAHIKRSRFQSLGWPLPKDFEDVAAKKETP